MVFWLQVVEKSDLKYKDILGLLIKSRDNWVQSASAIVMLPRTGSCCPLIPSPLPNVHLMWKDGTSHGCRGHMPSRERSQRLFPSPFLSIRKENCFESPSAHFPKDLSGERWITYSLLHQPLAKGQLATL